MEYWVKTSPGDSLRLNMYKESSKPPSDLNPIRIFGNESHHVGLGQIVSEDTEEITTPHVDMQYLYCGNDTVLPAGKRIDRGNKATEQNWSHRIIDQNRYSKLLPYVRRNRSRLNINIIFIDNPIQLPRSIDCHT